VVASLPLLDFDGEPPMSPEAFLEYCQTLLAPDDLDTLSKIVAGRLGEVDHPAIQAYAARETQLRNAVARVRAGRAGVDAQRYVRDHAGWQVAVEDAVAHAMAMGDPLQRERMLDRLRWQQLDEVAGMPAFGEQAVYAYALRLRILERWSQLSEQRGMELAQRIVEDTVAGAST
jgi:hypothetical protein